jgi:HlyD family secretion protein
MSASDLALLSRASDVPRPARRWRTRVLVPVVIVVAVVGLLGYAGRGVLCPGFGWWGVPLWGMLGGAGNAEAGHAQDGRGGSVLSQAPGWIEPSPYPEIVPALTEGVVREVLVLEGQAVEKDQVVARLEDRDAKLALRRVEAELSERRAAVERARADVGASEFRADELRDEINRKRDLVPIGGVGAGEFTRLELRLRGAEQDIAAAKASLAAAEAGVATHQVMCEEAALALERTEIRSPVAGTVLSRHVEPGTRIVMSARSEAMNTTVLRVYRPEALQVRVDVPLADAGKIVSGARAEVTTEAVPDGVFEGRVILIGHEANIQRNTVPVKVAIEKPSGALKPEMLARVRFLSTGSGGASGLAPSAASVRVLAAEAALFDRGESGASVWQVDARSVAMRRQVVMQGAAVDGYILVTGLNPGDRLVVDPPSSLREGSRVRVLGEKAGAVP